MKTPDAKLIAKLEEAKERVNRSLRQNLLPRGEEFGRDYEVLADGVAVGRIVRAGKSYAYASYLDEEVEATGFVSGADAERAMMAEIDRKMERLLLARLALEVGGRRKRK